MRQEIENLVFELCTRYDDAVNKANIETLSRKKDRLNVESKTLASVIGPLSGILRRAESEPSQCPVDTEASANSTVAERGPFGGVEESSAIYDVVLEIVSRLKEIPDQDRETILGAVCMCYSFEAVNDAG